MLMIYKWITILDLQYFVVVFATIWLDENYIGKGVSKA